MAALHELLRDGPAREAQGPMACDDGRPQSFQPGLSSAHMDKLMRVTAASHGLSVPIAPRSTQTTRVHYGRRWCRGRVAARGSLPAMPVVGFLGLGSAAGS
jgi:hypothetical protein